MAYGFCCVRCLYVWSYSCFVCNVCLFVFICSFSFLFATVKVNKVVQIHAGNIAVELIQHVFSMKQ